MGDFIITRSTELLATERSAPILNALSILQRDIDEVLTTDSGEKNQIFLQADSSLSAEEYCIQVEADRLLLHYGDDLGAVYGLLFLSEHFLGVQPFAFWNRQKIPQRPAAPIPLGVYRSPKRAVRFRGWLISDEAFPGGWKTKLQDKLEIWRRSFETVLRCGGNMVIPRTEQKENKDQLCFLALDMGLWLTQHHTEFLGVCMSDRVQASSQRQISYTSHPELFETLWQESIDKFAGRKVLWAIGYRGQEQRTSPSWSKNPVEASLEKREADTDSLRLQGEIVGKVICRQMELVRRQDPNACFCTNLSGEMTELYQRGFLSIPEEVIKIWEGGGKTVNQHAKPCHPLPQSAPHSKNHGLYCHPSFDNLQATNSIAMSQNSPFVIAQELKRALENGLDTCWNFHAGSIRSHVYFLDLIRQIWDQGQVHVLQHARQYAKNYYGSRDAAELLLSFSNCASPYGSSENPQIQDPYYNFVFQAIARALLRGQTKEAFKSLLWMADQESFVKQAAEMAKQCAQTIPDWQAYLKRCAEIQEELPPEGAKFLDNTLILQAKLHLSNCEGLQNLCQGALCLQQGACIEACLYINRTVEAHRVGIRAVEIAGQGELLRVHHQDSFSSIRLSVRMLEAFQNWICARQEGERIP